MDLAKYCVDAVLVEGRSVRAVAAATGASKSWVHRQVALYRFDRQDHHNALNHVMICSSGGQRTARCHHAGRWSPWKGGQCSTSPSETVS